MGEPLVITQSTLRDYHRCKRRWTLKHVWRRARERYSSPLHIGNLVHDALADWYAGRLEDPVAFIHERADREAAEYPQDERSIRKDEDLATIMVTGYLEWLEETGEDYELEQVAPERAVQIQLVGASGSYGPVVLRGKIDGKARTRDGWTAFLEHKSVGNFVDLPAIARMDPQLLTYHLLDYLEHLERMRESLDETEKLPPLEPDGSGVLAGGAILNLLRKVKRTATAKPPFYMRHPERHNVDQLRSHWRHVVATAREMQWRIARLEAGEDHHEVAPPNVRSTCRWDCEFFALCPLMDDGSDWRAVLESEYPEADPLERYGDDVEELER